MVYGYMVCCGFGFVWRWIMLLLSKYKDFWFDTYWSAFTYIIYIYVYIILYTNNLIYIYNYIYIMIYYIFTFIIWCQAPDIHVLLLFFDLPLSVPHLIFVYINYITCSLLCHWLPDPSFEIDKSMICFFVPF